LIFGSEISAAFHLSLLPAGTPIAAGAGEVAVKQAWWRQSITNATFFQAYPKVKGFCLFEYLKPEESTERDFRFTWPDGSAANGSVVGTLNEFVEDLQLVTSMYAWANVTGNVNKESPAPVIPQATFTVGDTSMPTMIKSSASNHKIFTSALVACLIFLIVW